jgi:hypothetical protein
MPQPDIDKMLSRFPGPVTLRPSRRRMLLHGSLVFVAGGVLMILAGAVARGERWMLWAGIGVFVLCAAVFIIMLLPSAAKLVLDGDGFELTARSRTSRIRWADTSIFELAFNRIVVFDDTRSMASRMGKFMKGVGGHSGALPNFGPLSEPDFVALLNRWRARALGSGDAR